ncbi:Glycosyltransferase involved in cell wall bisynthesis [Fibrobacter sp. UWR3]|uniref:glycosyltransferase n=1 Tax=Fibrobacter sp. UWR3 TaxID=1896217 RepID=UPI0009148F7D|nr:glycosyltransferase [Fibrobacter sp. UWR3]SHN02719.1 Glycosyltransferase involved in cell wall bisynthesis [Fibrobacter sp. UWR3]
MIKYSFVVPVYNVKQYLYRCVNSVLEQDYKDFEMILVDDGSSDGSQELCDLIRSKDNRVKVIHKPNGGLSDARNVGMQNASGEYIIFLDSDDFILNNVCLELDCCICESVDVIVMDASVNTKNFWVHDPSLKGILLNGKEFLKRSLKKKKMPMAAWLYIYKKSFLDANKLMFKKGILHEDEQFTPRAILAAKSVVYSGIMHYGYEIRPESIMTKKDKSQNLMDFYETCLELEILYKRISDFTLQRFLRDSLVQKYLSIYQLGNLYKKSFPFSGKFFLLRNSKLLKTKMKSFVFFISPRLYCFINEMAKTVLDKCCR